VRSTIQRFGRTAKPLVKGSLHTSQFPDPSKYSAHQSRWRTEIPLICKYYLHARRFPKQAVQQMGRLLAVVLIRAVNEDPEQKSHCIDENMAFSTDGLLVFVVAARAGH
jgi:hypothetical protein